MRVSSTLALLFLGCAAPALAIAQQAPPATPNPQQGQPQPPEEPVDAGGSSEGLDDAVSGEDIVVTGSRPPGSVPGDIAPELQLTPADIRAYGVGSIEDLVTELGPQLRSGASDEPPVILINGRRSGGFQEIRRYPPEALLRVDILPEEAALKFGYRADQRVINFVFRNRFRSYIAEAEVGVPTEGGSSETEIELGHTRIVRGDRMNFNAEFGHRSNLLESERDLLSTAAAGRPYAIGGNIVGPAGGEIDPALSAAAGVPVTLAAVPAGAATGAPELADFLGGANAAAVTDVTPFRTLQSAQDNVSANASYATTIFGNVAATGTARFERTETESLRGLPAITLALPAGNPLSPFAGPVSLYRYADLDPLTQNSRNWAGNATAAFNGDMGRWRWSLNASYDRAESETRTERGLDTTGLQASLDLNDPAVNPFGDVLTGLPRTVDSARSVSNVGALDALASGTLFALPAGDVSTSLRVVGRTSDLESRSERSGVLQLAEIGRDSVSARGNIDLPIANEARDILPFLGRLSVNANAEVEELSDFGTQTTLGYGLNWRPIDAVRLLVSKSDEERAPSPQSLGNPILVTPNVRVFDYVRGEAVDVTTVSGGNPDLLREVRHVFKAGLNVKPLEETNLTLSADYTDTRIDNPISGFPAVTAEIAAAFPERFERDAQGRLTRYDGRSVNFARSDSSEVRWGFNFFERGETARSRREQAERQTRMGGFRARREQAQASGQPLPERRPRADGGGERRGSGGGGFGGRGGGGGGSNLQLSLYHTVHLEESRLIRTGLPEIDALDGGAFGNNGGGQPRHEIEFVGGYTRDGIGLRLRADYFSGTDVNGGVAGANALRFGDLATFNLRLFAELGQQPGLIRAQPFLRNTRVSLNASNLFNARQRVTDAQGVVPITYQPALINALGRVVTLSLRKQF